MARDITDEAVGITTAIADALDYAHRHNVIHRDVLEGGVLSAYRSHFKAANRTDTTIAPQATILALLAMVFAVPAS